MGRGLANVLVIIVSGLMFYQIPAFAEDDSVDTNYAPLSFADFLSHQDTCSSIVNNYLDAVGEYSSTVVSMIPLSNNSYVTQVLNGTKTNIQQDNLITYNAIQADTGAIESVLNTYPNKALNKGFEQLHSQLGSMHTRVDQWKVTECREKHACDLGEAGYCDEKHFV